MYAPPARSARRARPVGAPLGLGVARARRARRATSCSMRGIARPRLARRGAPDRPAPRASRAARAPPSGRRPRSPRGPSRRAGRPSPARRPARLAARPGSAAGQPGAVTGLAVGGDRPAVPDAAQALEQRVDDRARGAAVDVGDEADAAGVALDGRIVESPVVIVVPSSRGVVGSGPASARCEPAEARRDAG